MKKIKIIPLILTLILIFTLSAPAALALEEPNIGAKAAVLVDMKSGRIIYEREKDQQRAPASLTKVMTVLLALEAIEDGRISMEDMVTAQNDCRDGLDETSSTSGIVPGLTLSMEELLYCALLQSANEACNVIASHISGSVEGFVAVMNARAQELGCVNTHFVNTNGLPAEGHYSSAYDMYLITKQALTHPVFLEICNTKSHQCPVPEVNGGQPMQNSNALINPGSIYGSGYIYEYASGVKTGYTRAAGNCLISTAEKDGVQVLAVIMGCDGNQNAGIDGYLNFEDSITAYDWVFDNFSYKSVLSASDPVCKAAVENAKDDAQAILRPAEDISLLLPSDTAQEDIKIDFSLYSDTVAAPVKAGQALGTARITIGGEDYGSVELINSSEVELARGRVFMLKLKEFFSNGWVIALVIILLVILTVYLLLLTRYRRLRREYMKKRRQAELLRAQEEQERWEREHPEEFGGSFSEFDPEYDIAGDDYSEDYDDFDAEESYEAEDYSSDDTSIYSSETDSASDESWEDILK